MTVKKKNNKLIYGLVGAIVILLGLAIWKGQQKPKGETVTTEKVLLMEQGLTMTLMFHYFYMVVA